MRSSTIFGITSAVLVIGAGCVYSAAWWIAAGQIEEQAVKSAQELPAHAIDMSWKSMRVAGYPLVLRLELGDVAVRVHRPSITAEIQAPLLSASVALWDTHVASLAAPAGIKAIFGPSAAPRAKLEVARLSGAFAGNTAARTLWLSLFDARLTAGDEVSARIVHGWAVMPRIAPAAHTEPSLAVAALVRDLALPAAPPGLSKSIDEVGVGVTAMGAWPHGPLREAATAWRDAGGAVALDHLDLRWGDIAVNGNGTLALDPALQPTGVLSGGVSGYDKLMSALVAAGRLKEKDARVGRLALALLAHPGKGGRAEIAAQLTIQDGEMRLGPAKIGPAPHIDW